MRVSLATLFDGGRASGDDVSDLGRPAWQAQGLCNGQGDLFFPESGRGVRVNAQVAAAKALCQQCPVSSPCRAMGATEDAGVWGGVDRDRNRTRRVITRRALGL